MEKIGFIGLGKMGHAMAGNIHKAGWPLYIHSRRRESANSLTDIGIPFVNSPAELASKCDIVICCASDDAALHKIVFGKDGIVSAVDKNRVKLIIDTSTTSPQTARKTFEELKLLNIGFLDAPVSGGDVGARNATLSIMVGGEQVHFEKALGLLSSIGKKIVYTGRSGSGQMTKCVNQIAVALSIIGMSEALNFAKNAGLDLEKTLDIITGGAADSWSLRNYAPRLLKNDLSAGFYSKHQLKDLKIAFEQAQELSLSLPGTKLALNMYEKMCNMGLGDLGNHALYELYNRNT